MPKAIEGDAQIQTAIDALSKAGASVRCSEVRKLLEKLGFVVRAGKKPGHNLVFHDGIEDFYSTSFNCGHGKNPEVKRPYLTALAKVLYKHQLELIRYLESAND